MTERDAESTEEPGGNTSRKEIEYLIRAEYGLIYVVSSEEERVEKELVAIGRGQRKTQPGDSRKTRKVYAWSITEGFKSLDGGSGYGDLRDPLKALEHICQTEDAAIFVLRDYHPYLKDPTVVRRLRDFSRDRQGGQHVVLLSPFLNVPVELEKSLTVVDFELPGKEVMSQLVIDVARTLGDGRPDVQKVIADKDARQTVVDAALGLTAKEAYMVLSKSLVKEKRFHIETILQEKKGIIRKSGILEFYQTDERLSDVGGLEVLKSWLSKRRAAFFADAKAFGLPTPKGILLLGIPGCGKSLTAKAIGAMWQMPLLRLDVGKVMGSLVGSSEENMRRAIRTAEAVAPSILWLDELEKGFSGTGSSGQTDGGTTSRVFGTFITWLQEKTSPVFVIATANNVSALPPELLRKGRFDEIFFVDLPSGQEREDIFRIHISKKDRDPGAFDMDKLVAESQGFSGSEIEQAVVSALYDAYEDGKSELTTERMEHSLGEIIPLSYTMKEDIDKMRQWAGSRARLASHENKSSEGDASDRKLEI